MYAQIDMCDQCLGFHDLLQFHPLNGMLVALCPSSRRALILSQCDDGEIITLPWPPHSGPKVPEPVNMRVGRFNRWFPGMLHRCPGCDKMVPYPDERSQDRTSRRCPACRCLQPDWMWMKE